MYGADFDRPNVQSDFRVLYDENEDGFDDSLREDPDVSTGFPIHGVFPVWLMPAMGALRAALRQVGIADGDIRNPEGREMDYIYGQTVHAGHRIGGYPCFEQEDPRNFL